MVLVRKAVAKDAAVIHRIAESLRYRPPGSEKGYLVHVRKEEDYRRLLESSKHSLVAEEGGKVLGYLLVYSMTELSELAKSILVGDKVISYVLSLGDIKALYADQVGVDLEARSRGIGQLLAAAMMKAHPGAHFVAAIMVEPSMNKASLRLAFHYEWKLKAEIQENEIVWGIYELIGN